MTILTTGQSCLYQQSHLTQLHTAIPPPEAITFTTTASVHRTVASASSMHQTSKHNGAY